MMINAISTPSLTRFKHPAFSAKHNAHSPEWEQSALSENCKKASIIGKSAIAVGGFVFAAGYLQNHLGYSLSGTFCAGAGALAWGAAKTIEKTVEALSSFQRYWKTARLHKS